MGEFVYGYRFLNNHCAFTVFFEGEDLSIYWGKSKYIGSFGPEGNCLRLHKVLNCTQNSDAYHRDKYRPNMGKVGDIEYTVEQGIGLSSGYTRFAVTDTSGNTYAIFDVTQEHNLRVIIIGTLIAISLIICIILFIKKRKS